MTLVFGFVEERERCVVGGVVLRGVDAAVVATDGTALLLLLTEATLPLILLLVVVDVDVDVAAAVAAFSSMTVNVIAGSLFASTLTEHGMPRLYNAPRRMPHGSAV